MFQGQTLDKFMAVDMYVNTHLDSIFSCFTYWFIFAFEFRTPLLYCVYGTVWVHVFRDGSSPNKTLSRPVLWCCVAKTIYFMSSFFYVLGMINTKVTYEISRSYLTGMCQIWMRSKVSNMFLYKKEKLWVKTKLVSHFLQWGYLWMHHMWTLRSCLHYASLCWMECSSIRSDL